MDMQQKERFIKKWEKYFPGAPLPVVFFYSDNEAGATKVKGPKSLEEHRCVIADIVRATRGRSLAFDVDSVGCGGGRKYLGFTEVLRPNFDYFLSYGIPGELEGERYKKSPELVGEIMKNMPKFSAPGRISFSNAGTRSMKRTALMWSSFLLCPMSFRDSSPSPTSTRANRTGSFPPSAPGAPPSSPTPISKKIRAGRGACWACSTSRRDPASPPTR